MDAALAPSSGHVPPTGGTETPETTQEPKIIRAKVELPELARPLGNVSQTCKMLGSSLDSCCRFKELYDNGGEVALAEISGRIRILQNRMPAEVEDAMVAIACEQPAWGEVRTA